MTSLARAFDWLQNHPWRGFTGALALWVFGAVGIDVLDSVTAWNPGGQVTELVGGLLGLPVTAVAVVVLFQHLERAQLQPVLNRRRRAARTALSAVSPRLVMAYLGETVTSPPTPRESSTAPILRNSAGVSEAAARLDAISDLLVALRTSQGSLRKLVATLGKPAEEVEEDLRDCTRLAEMVRAQSGYISDPESARDLDDQVVRDAAVLLRTRVFDELPSLPDHVRLPLDDVRELSTDPEEIATIDGLMTAIDQWSLHMPSRSSFLYSFDTLYQHVGQHRYIFTEAIEDAEFDAHAARALSPSELDQLRDIESHFRRAAQLLRVIYAVNGDREQSRLEPARSAADPRRAGSGPGRRR